MIGILGIRLAVRSRIWDVETGKTRLLEATGLISLRLELRCQNSDHTGKIFFWNMWSCVKNNFNGINFGRKGFRMEENVMEVKSEDSSEKKSEKKSEERTERREESLKKISVELKSEKLMLR